MVKTNKNFNACSLIYTNLNASAPIYNISVIDVQTKCEYYHGPVKFRSKYFQLKIP